MSLSEFRLIAAPHTPFHDDGQLNLEAVKRQARLLKRTQVNGAFVAGSTGESSSLSTDERILLAERWCEVARTTDLEVIIHVGDNCQANACRMATHAQTVGADAIAAYSPCYFKPTTVEALIEYLAPIANAASDLPFYFYDIPFMTGVRLPMVAFLKQGKRSIPNLVGLKYSNDDLVQLQECVGLQQGEFELLFGRDEALMAGVSLGVGGAVGSTYNYAAPLYRQMLAALERGDLEAARTAQARSVALVRTLAQYEFLPASKAVMGMVGVDCGPIRLPLRNLSDSDVERLREQLEELNLFEDALAPARARVAK